MGLISDAARAALTALSTYQKPRGYGFTLEEGAVAKIRDAIGGGQLNPLPTTQVRWYLPDLEDAMSSADAGNLMMAGQLWAYMKTDGTLRGLMGAMSAGIVSLPRRFYGDEALAARLRPENETRSDFDDMHPPTECEAMVADADALGVAVGELSEVKGRLLPRLTRLEPEFLQYRWNEDRWYYRSIAGLLPITPGDGHWVLHVAGPRVNPWRSGLWKALGRSFINKEHAMLGRANYSGKLANPARAATAPLGASQDERVGFISRLIAWGYNTVFELPPGWDVKLIESKGEGYQVFKDEIAQSDQEYMITVAGQVVTTTGGSGFSNADVHRLVRADRLAMIAKAWAHTLNTQTLPLYAALHGKDPQKGATVAYVTKAPKDQEAEARTMNTVGSGIRQIDEALEADGLTIEKKEIMTRFELPVRALTPEEITARASLRESADDPEPAESSSPASESVGTPGGNAPERREV